MRFKQVGNKSDLVGVVIRNNDIVQINAGQPVILSLDGNGTDVILPATSPNTAGSVWSMRYGVCLKNVAVGYYGEAQVFGFCNDVQVIITTRANTTASWSTTGALSIGQFLTVDTVNNVFITMATSQTFYAPTSSSGVSNLTYVAQTVSLFDPFAVVGVSASTVVAGPRTYTLTAGMASSTADTLTAITASIQAFVRMM